MSKFAAFMKSNQKTKPNAKYPATASLCDEKGNPLEWEFRPLGSKEVELIRDECTKQVQIPGKPGQYRPEFNSRKYLSKVIAASVVMPDLNDAELQDSYGVKTPEDLLYMMVPDAGEYDNLTLWFNKYQGFNKSFDDKVTEAKN